MKIALAQINQIIGDFEGNYRRIEAACARAEKAGADLVVFPETALTGPFPGDLLIFDKFVRDNLELLDRLTARRRRIGILVGYIRPCPRGGKLENAAALIEDGQIVSTYVKNRSAVHGAFDEFRYFESGDTVKPVDFRGTSVGITICEDICNPDFPGNRRPFATISDPAAEAVTHGADVLINLAASPFTVENHRDRVQSLKDAAFGHHRPVLFVNHVGGFDEWIFDGGSMALNADGKIIAQAESFAEDLLMVDIDNEEAATLEETREDIESNLESIVRGLVLGTRDFVRKRGLESVLIELSGDVNSAVAAAVASAALGAKNVRSVYLGPPPEGRGTPVDPAILSACIGISLERFDAALVTDVFETIAASAADVGTLPLPEPTGPALRQMILQMLADEGGHMLISTEDKTDFYLFGPEFPGAELSMLSDIPKALLWKTAKHLGEMGIPPFKNIVSPSGLDVFPQLLAADNTPASIERVDTILDHCIAQRLSADTIISLGFDPALTEQIVRMVKSTEAKRNRAPTGLNITRPGFGYYPKFPLGHGWITD